MPDDLAPGPAGDRYQVVLLDDDTHTYNDVMGLLGTVFGIPLPQAYAVAEQVDRTGRGVVFVGSRAEAEAKRQAVRDFGPDPAAARDAGPLGVVVERRDTDEPFVLPEPSGGGLWCLALVVLAAAGLALAAAAAGLF